MFSPQVFISVGDEYDKREPQDPNVGAKHEKTFKVSAPRHPHMSDSTFSRFESLSAGDPYRDTTFGGPFRQPDKDSPEVARAADKPPFRPTNRPHKSSGKGDYYGTFDEKNIPKHEAEFPPLVTTERKVETRSRAILTNPPKKGTYGYSGLSIGGAGEVQYVSDPYFSDQHREALERKAGAAKNMGAPFRSRVHTGAFLDETEHGVSKVYSLSKPLPPKKEAKPEPEPVAAKPWVPGGALRKEITKFPEYEEDPYDLKERKVRELKQKERSYKPWCPAGNRPYQYIYSTPIQYNPPPVK